MSQAIPKQQNLVFTPNHMRLSTIDVTQYGTAVYLKVPVLWDVTPYRLLAASVLKVVQEDCQEYQTPLLIPSRWRQEAPPEYW